MGLFDFFKNKIKNKKNTKNKKYKVSDEPIKDKVSDEPIKDKVSDEPIKDKVSDKPIEVVIVQQKEESVIDSNNEIKRKLFNYVAKYDKGLINKEELKDFCKLMIEYCKQTRHSEAALQMPSIKFDKLHSDTDGSYRRTDNSITINEIYLESILKKESKLSDLINTIGHEMTHYHQNSNMAEYDNSSIDKQHAIDEKTKTSIESYKNYFDLKEEDVHVLHDLLAPYLKEDELPIGYETVEDFYKDVSYASYYTIQSEREARDEGVSFAIDFYKMLEKGNYGELSDDFIMDEKIHLEVSQDFNERDYAKYKKNIDIFSEIYTLNEDKILEIVEKVESKNGSLKDFDNYNYEVALKFLIKNKSMEQRESLLKNAIFNGYSRLTRIIVESLQNELDFKANKDKISTLVSGCLTGEVYGDPDFKVNYSNCFIDYSKILTQEDFEDVVTKIVKDDSYNARSLISFGEGIKTFSLEAVLKCQESTFNDGSSKYNLKDDKNFFNALFSQVAIEDKIKYLKSGLLKPEVNGILVECIKNDLRYESFKGEIEEILPSAKVTAIKESEVTDTFDTTNKAIEVPDEDNSESVVNSSPNIDTQSAITTQPAAKTQESFRQKYDISTEQGMNNLFVAYARLNQDYYNKEKRTPEDIRRRKNLNAQMKRILQYKLKNEKDLETGMDLNLYVETNFSDNLIEEVAKSKTTTLELFYIMSRGVYEKDGKSIRLTQKQRQSLASVLERVSEKRLEIDSSQKVIRSNTQEKGKETDKILGEG